MTTLNYHLAGIGMVALDEAKMRERADKAGAMADLNERDGQAYIAREWRAAKAHWLIATELHERGMNHVHKVQANIWRACKHERAAS